MHFALLFAWNFLNPDCKAASLTLTFQDDLSTAASRANYTQLSAQRPEPLIQG